MKRSVGTSFTFLLVLSLAVIVGLAIGSGVISAALIGGDSPTYQACVDKDGDIRLLGFDFPDGDDDDDDDEDEQNCKKKEILIELPSSGWMTDLEDRFFALEHPPTPTATALPLPTPTAILDPFAAYQPFLNILGSTGVILPLVDTSTGGLSASFATVGGTPATFCMD